jgi:hypothetical protein
MSEPRLDRTKEENDRTYTCSYCNEEWKESELDNVGFYCVACSSEEPPEQAPDRTDHHLHAANHIANEGMRPALRWIRQENPHLKETWLSRDFLTYVFAYEHLTKDIESGLSPDSIGEASS